MNIGIDARCLVEKKVGFGFFLSNMLTEILKIDTENTYYLCSDRKIIFNVSEYKNVKFLEYKDSLLCPKSFYYYYKLARWIKDNGVSLDVFWGTMHLMPKGLDNNTKKILTIHDFTHFKFPASTTKFNLLISRLFIGPSIKHSDKVVCISRNTEKELKEYYPNECKEKDISVIYEGGYSEQEQASLTYKEKDIRPEILKCKKEKYILFVGTIEPRKNIKLLIDVAPILKDKVKVIICGKIGWEKDEVISELNNTNNLIYFNYVSQEEKLFLMKNAFCQVQPSLYEGFGLPVVESMQVGTVVMVANNSSLKELVEFEDLKFDTFNIEDFYNKVTNLIEKPLIYSNAKKYCYIRGKQFSWKNAAESYFKIII